MPSTALIAVATGKYTEYIPSLFQSFLEHFHPTEETRMVVFTDGPIPVHDRMVRAHWRKLGWPDDTMKRYHAFLWNWDVLSHYDYIFHIDADMRLVGEVGPEILSSRTATEHPGFVGKVGSYETRPESAAYVVNPGRHRYYCGGFNGGRGVQFRNLAYEVARMVDSDSDKGLVPVWHDESCVNRFYASLPPTKVLSPSYCYPESWDMPYDKRILALDKNHDAMRDWPADWWNQQGEARADDFRRWVGSWDTPSRVAVRDHVLFKKYGSIVDIGCGIGVDHDGYRAVGSDILYTGVDSCNFFIDQLLARGVVADIGSAEELPIASASVDVAYMRHVLEHLPGCERALWEAIRVAREEVIVVFFLVPGETDRIELSTMDGAMLYHNQYSRGRVDRFLRSQSRVREIVWEPVGDREVTLHVYLKEAP
jgi:SAM-dependent methyltransferase